MTLESIYLTFIIGWGLGSLLVLAIAIKTWGTYASGLSSEHKGSKQASPKKLKEK